MEEVATETIMNTRDEEMHWKSKYLGLPYLIDRSMKKIFHYIKDGVWKKFEGGKRSSYLMMGKKC